MGALRGVIGPRRMCFARVEILPPYGVLLQQPRVVNGILDTGAEGTILSERVAAALRLPETGFISAALGFGDPVLCTTTAANLRFQGDPEANRQSIFTVTTQLIVAPGNFEGNYDLLIGPSALEGAKLTIDYGTSWWLLEW